MSVDDFSEKPVESGGREGGAPGKSVAGAIWGWPGRAWRRYGLFLSGAAILGGLIYLASSADGFIKRGELEREKLKLEAEIETLQDENRILRQKLERLKSDPAYVEDEARKKLGLVRPGETVYRLSEEPDLSDDPVPDQGNGLHLPAEEAPRP